MSENLETKPNAVPAPSPATPAAPAVPAVPSVANPAVTAQTVEAKQVAAIVRLRQERSGLKRRLAELEATKPAPPAAVETPAAVIPTPVVNQPPAQKAETVVDDAELKAIQAVAMDKDIANYPGALTDLMDIVDSNPRIAKLNAIDSTLAYREAKILWLEGKGIGQQPPIPVATKSSGGMAVATSDLGSLFTELDTCKPGTKRYRELVSKVNQLMAAGQ